MRFEIDPLIEMETWEFVRHPEVGRVFKTQWAFDVKQVGTGRIIRYKARLAAKRAFQIQGIDFRKVYSPVTMYATIRLIMASAVSFK